jgi:hypothetical protein
MDREREEELQAHIAEAVAQGRDAVEVRRAFGYPLHHRETSRDIRLIPWLETLRAHAVFGWRQFLKNKGASAAAIFSLALAIGSCTAAFRLIDATLWRPLPVPAPDRRYVLSRESTGPDGRIVTGDNCAYPMLRALVKGQAELIAVSAADRIDLTFASDQEMEKPTSNTSPAGCSNRLASVPLWGACSPRMAISHRERIPTPSFLTTTGSGDLPRIGEWSGGPSILATRSTRSSAWRRGLSPAQSPGA